MLVSMNFKKSLSILMISSEEDLIFYWRIVNR